MTRIEGAIQLSLPEGSVAVITTTRAKRKGEPLAKPGTDVSPEIAEIIVALGEEYRQVRSWEELFSGGRANLRQFSELVNGFTDDQFEQFPDAIAKITGEMPAEGRTMGSRQTYPADFASQLTNLAVEIRTLPVLKKAS